MRGNIITMHMARGRVTRAGNLYQYDYGQKLVFAGVSLPAAYEVHFSNQERGQSKTMIGDETGVVIPDEYLTTGEPVHVWVYLHDGEDDGETEYHGIIGVTKRAEPTDQEPTPEQQSVIDQAIAALNSGIIEVEEIAAGIPSAIGDAFGEITADAETLQPEDDATASFDSETKKLTIGVPRGAKGNPGDPGAPGYSPSAKVTKSGKTATITITDANGTTSETVSDGEDGDPTTLIDDNSGSGETAKTWSANKLTTELAKKYEKPNSGIPASDMAAGVIPDVTGKADKVASATSGNFAALDENGNLTDSGHKDSDYLKSHQDISGKADKVTEATSGNFAGLDSNGNLTDSGKKPSDFLTEHQDISGKADKSEIGTVPEGETVEGQISDLLQAISEKYTKPSGGIPATDLASGVIPDISGLMDDVETIEDLTEYNTVSYSLNLGTGAINSSGDDVGGEYTGNSCRTNGYIDITGSFEVKVSLTRASGATIPSGASNFHTYLFYYDSSKTYISRYGGPGMTYIHATRMPSNTKYVRVSFTYTKYADLAAASITGTQRINDTPTVVHTVNGLTMQNATVPQNGVVLGDSIAFGFYSYWDGNLRKNADDIFSDVALTAAPVRISDWLAQYYGIPITNIAKRGTGWVSDSRNIGNAWVTAQATDFSQYDFVALCFGVNDYINKSTIGTISDNEVGTVIGNMIHTLEKIYTDNPLAKVVVFSPLNTWGQYRDSSSSSHTLYGDASTHYALGYDFGGTSYTLQALIDAMEAVCDRYDVRHVVMSQGCTVNVFNIKDILIDGLHPSQESMKSIASDMFHTMMFR